MVLFLQLPLSSCVVRKACTRVEIQYMVDGKEIPMVSYLGCVLDEHLDLEDMVHD